MRADHLELDSLSPDHYLLVLSDSALPLGSFAFSNGLESFIAHHRPQVVGHAELQRFIVLSIASVSSTVLPYMLAAHRRPQDLVRLDNDLDASTLCQVARRASVAQGRALLGVWDRCFASNSGCWTENVDSVQALKAFTAALRHARPSHISAQPNCHFPVIWGAVNRAMSIPLKTAAYVFLFKHAQSLLSAAVRSSVIGPYKAQDFLTCEWLQESITCALNMEWESDVGDAGQVVPLMDLWVGLHEKLYSRIFNS